MTDATTIDRDEVRQLYGQEARERAMTLAETAGLTAAARQTGCHRSTVARWLKAATRQARTKNPEASAGLQRWNDERRVIAAARLGELTDRLIEHMLSMDLDGSGPGEISQCLFRVIDRAELLSGRATGREEIVDTDERQRLLADVERLTERLAEH